MLLLIARVIKYLFCHPMTSGRPFERSFVGDNRDWGPVGDRQLEEMAAVVPPLALHTSSLLSAGKGSNWHQRPVHLKLWRSFTKKIGRNTLHRRDIHQHRAFIPTHKNEKVKVEHFSTRIVR